MILKLKHARALRTVLPLFAVLLAPYTLLRGQTSPPTGAAPNRLTLEQAVQEALEHNLTRLADRYNISIADARIVTAKLRPNPVFSAGLDYQDMLGTGFSSDTNSSAGPPEFNFRVDFVLERGGKRAKRIDAAENAKAVTQLQVLDGTRQLVLDVDLAFVDVLLAKENLAVAQENLKALNSIVETNRARVKAGDLAAVELFRSNLAALQFQNQVRQAALRLRTANNRLQALLGRTARSERFDVQGPIRSEAAQVTLAEVKETALSRRPDILALRRDEARSLAELRLQIAQGKVDFTVGTQYHHQYGNAHGDAMGFFFSTPLPVFNRNQGEIERARLEQAQIGRRIKALELSISADVEVAFDQFTAAKQTLETVERDMLGRAREVRDTMDYSYRRGEASFVEFLDAQRTFNETLQTYNETRADYARNLYFLDSVTGRSVNP